MSLDSFFRSAVSLGIGLFIGLGANPPTGIAAAIFTSILFDYLQEIIDEIKNKK